MSRFLSIVLTFLLAVAPLQPVSASTAMQTQDSMEYCHKVASPDTHHEGVHGASLDCEQCNSHQTCDESCCNTGLCSSVTMALMPISSSITGSSSPIHDFLYANGLLHRVSLGPYRPPRA